MSGYIAIPKAQFFDDAGNVLAGGLVYTYQVGTTTLKSSYPTAADAVAKTNANANPIVLDAAGRASIVLAGLTKVVLKDSDSNTIWTQDYASSDNTVLDTNGNELVDYITVASSVNYITFEGGTTTNPAIIDTAGSDATPNLKIQADDGVGTVTVVGLVASAPTITGAVLDDTTVFPNAMALGASATGPSSIKLYEDSDNGSNYVIHSAASSLSTNATYKWPIDGTADYVLKTDGSGNLAWANIAATIPAASTSQVGVAAIATTADMEAASALTVIVPPGSQHRHPGHPKVVGRMDNAAAAIGTTYNVSSFVDNGAGDFSVNTSVTFSSANAVRTTACATNTSIGSIVAEYVTTSQVRYRVFNAAGAAVDLGLTFIIFGDI